MSTNNNNSNNNTVSSTASNASSRMTDFLTSTPLYTTVLLVVNLAVHVLVFLTSYPINDYTFSPIDIYQDGEYYRIFTSAFLHGGIMHIAMNMMSLIAVGAILETQYGTLKFFYMTWVVMLFAGFLDVAIAWICTFVTGDQSYMYSNSIGYSGVLFAYAGIEAFHSAQPSRSIFGIFSVPTKSYPFILLIVLQVILPNISLFGHLSGLLAGLFLISGVGNALLMPTQGCCEWLEANVCLLRVKRISSYRLVTSRDLVHSSLETRSASAICFATWNMLVYLVVTVLSFVGSLFAIVGHIVGCPVERIGSIFQDGYRTMASGCAFVYSAAANLFSGRILHTSQGYELVPNQEQPMTDSNSYDVEAGGARSSTSAVSNPVSVLAAASSAPAAANTHNTYQPAQGTGTAAGRVYQRDHNKSRLLAQFENNAKLQQQQSEQAVFTSK